jgi:hypothetical protein
MNHHTRDRVRSVIMSARCMVNAIAPAPCRPALETAKLSYKTRVVQKLYLMAIHERQ